MQGGTGTEVPMVQQSRRVAVAEGESPALAEPAPMPLESGNRELLEKFGLAPSRDEEAERPWLEGPEFETASLLCALRA